MSTPHGSLSSQAVRRLQGGELIRKEFDNDEIVDILDVSVSSVKNWRRRLKQKDGELQSLARKKGSGRHPKLDDMQKSQLREILLAGAVASGYGSELWTSKIVADLILKTFNIPISPRSVRRLLRSMGFSPQLPTTKSDKYSDQAVLEWANRTWKRLKKKPAVSAFP